MCNNTFYLFQASDLLGAIFVFSCRVGWWRSSDEKFFLFTAMTSLIVSLILFITKLLQYSKNVPHWQFICIGFDALWAFFYLISSNIIIKWIRFNSDRLFRILLLKRELFYCRYACGVLGGGVFFGYLSLICYLVDLVLRLLQMKSNQGQTSTSGGDNPDSSGFGPWTTQEPLPKYWFVYKKKYNF